MLTRGKRRILFWLSVAFFLALVPVTVLYSLGYRFDRNFVLRKTGGLYIASDVSGSEIFINGELERRTNLLQSGVFVQNLAPNRYKVLVAREGYLGWSKELQIFFRFTTRRTTFWGRLPAPPSRRFRKKPIRGDTPKRLGTKKVWSLGYFGSGKRFFRTIFRIKRRFCWLAKMSGILSFFRKDGMCSSPLLTTACGRWNWMAAAAGEVTPSIKERSRISRSSPATTFFMSWTMEI